MKGVRGVRRIVVVFALAAALASQYVSADSGFDAGEIAAGRSLLLATPTTVEAGSDRRVFVGQPVTLSATATPGSTFVSLWNETFDSYPVGTLTPPWFDQSTGLNYAEISASVFRGSSGKSLHLVDTSFVDGTNAYRSLANPTQLDLTVWVYATTTTGAGTVVFNSPSAWGTARAGLGPNGQFVYHLCSASYQSSPLSYNAGVWYELRFVLDASSDTYDMYVDGTLIVNDDAFCVGATSFNGVVLNSGGDQAGEFYFDDIGALGPQPLQILEYRWDLDGAVDLDSDGNSTNDSELAGQTVTTTYGIASTYLVTVTAVDSLLAQSNDSLRVFVADPTVTPTTVDAGPDLSGAEGQPSVLSAAVTPGTAWQEVWSDGFDAYPPGPLSAPWIDRSTGPNTATISNTVRRGTSGNSVRLADSSVLDGANAERSLGVGAGALDIAAWIYPVTTSGLGTVVLNSNARWGAVRVGVGPGGVFVYDVCGPSYSSLVVPYLANVWYEVRVVADAATDRYDMYVNGSLEVSQAPFCGVVDSFDHVWLSAGGNSLGDVYFDDVTLWGRVNRQVQTYVWDLDGAIDADGDGNFTNDSDAVGPTVTAILGDDGDYRVTLTVSVSGGVRLNDSLRLTVANLPPSVSPTVPSVVSVTTGIQASLWASDPGSDDLTVDWQWSDGGTANRLYLNGAGPDPPHSPQGLFPFVVLDNSSRGFPAPGIYRVTISVEDDDGGISSVNRTVDVRDVPVTIMSVGLPSYVGTVLFVNSSTPFSLSAADRSGFGIDATYYRVDGGIPVAYTAPFTVGASGPHTISYWSTDNLGGVEAPKTLDLYVDLSPPVTVLEVQGPFVIIGPTSWIRPSAGLWMNATDGESGVLETLYRYRVGGVWSGWAPAPTPLAPPVSSGPFELEFYSRDNLGQSEAASAAMFSVDGEPPVSTLIPGSPVSGSWVRGTTPLTIEATDSGVGVRTTTYRVWHAGSWSPLVSYTSPFTLASGEGPYFVEFSSIDALGNVETIKNVSLSVDDSPPETILQVAGSHIQIGAVHWVVPTAQLWLNATDAGSGANSTLHRFGVGGLWSTWRSVSGPISPPVTDGAFFVEVYSIDRLGQSEEVFSLSFVADGIPPTSAAASGTPTSGRWITSQTPITISADDGSGIGLGVVRFRIAHNGTYGVYGTYTAPFQLLQGEGVYTLEFESEDLLGNREPTQSVSFEVDDTPPRIDYEVEYSASDFEFTVDASAEDEGSGLASLEYRVGGGEWRTYEGPFTIRTKVSVNVEFRAVDLLGNTGMVSVPGTGPRYVNLKPLLSVVFASLLLLVGFAVWRRGGKSRMTLVLGVTFAAVELLLGLASWVWDVLLFPPWIGAGFALNSAITAGGIAVIVLSSRYFGGTVVSVETPPSSRKDDEGSRSPSKVR